MEYYPSRKRRRPNSVLFGKILQMVTFKIVFFLNLFPDFLSNIFLRLTNFLINLSRNEFAVRRNVFNSATSSLIDITKPRILDSQKHVTKKWFSSLCCADENNRWQIVIEVEISDLDRFILQTSFFYNTLKVHRAQLFYTKWGKIADNFVTMFLHQITK